MKYAFVLGRNPDLSIAELGCLFGDSLVVAPRREIAFVDDKLPSAAIVSGTVADGTVAQNFLNRLGGSTEIIEIFAENVGAGSVEGEIVKFLKVKAGARTGGDGGDGGGGGGKFPFAINIFPENGKTRRTLNGILTRVKKTLRAGGIKANFMNKGAQNVNSVFAFKQGLVERGTNISMIEGGGGGGGSGGGGGGFTIGVTIAMQDFEAYSLRDYSKPFRDVRVGMLPPKLSQIMINLATTGGAAGSATGATIFDPFCGTGTLLMEAMLMGFNAIGSDKEERLADGAEENVKWLRGKFGVADSVTSKIFQKDAVKIAKEDLVGAVADGGTLAIATEPFLGMPLSTFPAQSFLEKLIGELSTLYIEFFKNLAGIVAAGTTIVFIFPYWKKPNVEKNKRKKLSTQHSLIDQSACLSACAVDKIETLGYSKTDFAPLKSTSLLYDRPDQVVGREIVRFVKK